MALQNRDVMNLRASPPEERKAELPARSPERDGDLVALLRALARHGLADGDWVCSLRTRVTGRLALERDHARPSVVVRTDLGCFHAAAAGGDVGRLSEWQRCAPQMGPFSA